MKRLVECKSLGIPLREDVAWEVDNLVKQLPKECQALRRKGAMPESAELVAGERADISMVSVESIDRDGDVVLSKGMDLTYFQRNPIVTFAHKYDELPVGKAQWIKKVKGGLRAKTVYSAATELAEACWKMTQEGIIRGKSIGFLPTTVRSPSHEELTRNPEWKYAGAVIDSAVLLEYAVAPIPVNQDALVEAVAKGLADAKTLSRLGLSVPVKRMTGAELADLIRDEFARHLANLTPEKLMEKALDRYRA